MDFLREYIGKLSRKPIHEYPFTQVVEVKAEEYIHHIPYCREDSLLVYGLSEPGGLYEVVIQKDCKGIQTAFSLFRTHDKAEAEKTFHILVSILQPLTSTFVALLTQDSLQEICNYMRDNPNQTLAHLAAAFSFNDCFKPLPPAVAGAPPKAPLVTDVNSVCPDTQITPLHLAIKSGRLVTVQAVLSLNPKFDLIDKVGNNCLHYAASTSREIIAAVCNAIITSNNNIPPNSPTSPTEQRDGQVLTVQPNKLPNSRDDAELLRLINARNREFASPIHLACLADKPDCVKELLKMGANVNGACVYESRPAHGSGNGASHPSSVNSSFDSSPENLDRLMYDQLDPKDMKNGGNPLHWAKSPQCMEPLIEMGCDIDAKNFQGETVLHVMVSRVKLPCVVTLLSYGADSNARGPNGNTPLHLAVKGGDVSVVQALVVFGAKLNVENVSGETPRHVAATAKRTNTQDMILYVLHSIHAKRCTRSNQASPCTDGCAAGGAFNGVPPDGVPFKRIVPIYDGLMLKSIVKEAVAAKKKRMFATNNSLSTDDINMTSPDDQDITMMAVDEESEANRVRLLTLDGGGIRGLILIQMLSVLEDMMGCPAYEFFNWISGTSTGGILALFLATGHSSAQCRQFYFRMKDKIFGGGRPYESEPLDSFLKKTLGEETTMADIIKPRVSLTATLADRFPADLHLFRNYKSPTDILGDDKRDLAGGYPISPKPEDTFLWNAARSSGAAPTYFRPCGRYLDGGLISNNPTLDALTEISFLNRAFEVTGRAKDKLRIDVAVSLGTGAIPVHDVQIIDVFRPDTLFGVAKMAWMASSLGQLLVDQASQADGQVVERAKAWCSSINVPFFRLNPPISDDIPLDEINNVKLVNVLWETTAYMLSRREEFEELVLLLQ